MNLQRRLHHYLYREHYFEHLNLTETQLDNIHAHLGQSLLFETSKKFLLIGHRPLH